MTAFDLTRVSVPATDELMLHLLRKGRLALADAVARAINAGNATLDGELLMGAGYDVVDAGAVRFHVNTNASVLAAFPQVEPEAVALPGLSAAQQAPPVAAS